MRSPQMRRPSGLSWISSDVAATYQVFLGNVLMGGLLYGWGPQSLALRWPGHGRPRPPARIKLGSGSDQLHARNRVAAGLAHGLAQVAARDARVLFHQRLGPGALARGNGVQHLAVLVLGHHQAVARTRGFGPRQHKARRRGEGHADRKSVV